MHYLKDVGDVSCIERPVRNTNFELWDIVFSIPANRISWCLYRIYNSTLDDIVIDMWTKIFKGNLEDFRGDEFWNN